MQVQLPDKYTVQYSDSSSKDVNYSNSTVPSTEEVLKAITDLIPNPDFSPWYAGKLRTLGYERFMYIVGQARKSSDTPQVLFKWMLKNPGVVK